jgi:hypothetical protein
VAREKAICKECFQRRRRILCQVLSRFHFKIILDI